MFAKGESRGASMAQVADEARQRMRDRMAQRAASNGEDASPNEAQDSHPKQGDLNPFAAAALGKLSPESLKVQLVDNLAGVLEDYSAPAEELLQREELQGISNLDDLLEHLHALEPVDLANEFVLANPDLDLKRLPYLPPLEPFKAILAMYLKADR